MRKPLTEEHKQSISESLLRYWDGKRHPIMNKNGYLTLTINGKKKYVHRMVMEEFLGRELDRKETVHHINGDKTDNRIENLVLMKTSEHIRHHAIENHLGHDRCGISPTNKTPVETIERVKELRRSGYLLKDICKETGLSYPTVIKYSKERRNEV